MSKFNSKKWGGSRILFCALALKGGGKQAGTVVLNNSVGIHSIWCS